MLDTTRHLNDEGVIVVDSDATLLQMNHMTPNITDTFDNNDRISVAVL